MVARSPIAAAAANPWNRPRNSLRSEDGFGAMRHRWYVVLDFSAFLSRRDIYVQNRHAARRATVRAPGEGAARENCDAGLREMAEARAAAGQRRAKLAGSGGGTPRRIRPHGRHTDESSLNLSSPWNTRGPRRRRRGLSLFTGGACLSLWIFSPTG